MKTVAIIPARGGSKGIPQKNIAPLAGKPLIAYTIEALLAAHVTKMIVVTTDCDRIAQAARAYDVTIVKRPAALSTDTASTESALLHVIEELYTPSSMPSYVLTLPPTSPLRTARTIREFVAHYHTVARRFDAMISLTETRNDYWIQDRRGQFARVFPKEPRRRQDRRPVYVENSALYLTRTAALIRTQSVLGTRCTGFPITEIEGTDINTPRDLAWAEFLITQGLVPHKT